jgi:hypothetical protein
MKNVFAFFETRHFTIFAYILVYTKKNFMVWVREWTIPTERPPYILVYTFKFLILPCRIYLSSPFSLSLFLHLIISYVCLFCLCHSFFNYLFFNSYIFVSVLKLQCFSWTGQLWSELCVVLTKHYPHSAPKCTLYNPDSVSLFILGKFLEGLLNKTRGSTSVNYNAHDWSERASIIQTLKNSLFNTDLAGNSSSETVTSKSLGIQLSFLTFKPLILIWPGERKDMKLF